MNKRFIFTKLIVLFCFVIAIFECTSVNAYQEYNESNTAVIKLNNQSFLRQSIGNFLQQEVNEMRFKSIDNQRKSAWSQSYSLTPGKHQIAITCFLNGAELVGEKYFVLNAKAGRAYTIYFPQNYTPTDAGCDQLILQ